MGAGDRYMAWVRAGAAHSQKTIPVHRPSVPTGLPPIRAAELMTAACSTESVVPDRAYHSSLPPELAPWYVYIEVLGHCIAVAVDGVYESNGDPWEYMTVAPVRMVRKAGWTVQDGIVVSPVPFDTGIGAVEWVEEDVEL
ncbi:hypothetical protein ACQP1W_22430 [Spirillospora sp. CA-255316]